MNKWLKRLLLGTVLATPVGIAFADWSFTPGSGGTFFSFICQTTKVCAATVPIDSSGTEKGIISNPMIIAPSVSPLPVTGTLTTSGNITAAQGAGANTSPWFTTIRQGGFDAIVTSAGRLSVDIGSTSLTGTVTANQGTASAAGWLVQPGNTANTTPWNMSIKQGSNTAAVTGASALKVDNSAVTQPISGSVTITGQPVTVNPAAATTGGCTGGHFLSAASNNATSVKATAGTLCELVVINTGASTADLRLYDVATSPTCSSATGVIANYPVQANTVGPGFAIPLGPFGKAFANGIGICLTGSNADNDNSNAPTGININYAYK